jgi:hypothetical protein
VNVPSEELVQFTGAIGAAVLARRRLEKLEAEGRVAVPVDGERKVSVA